MLDEILYRFSQVLGVDLDENSNIVLLIPKFSHLRANCGLMESPPKLGLGAINIIFLYGRTSLTTRV